MSTDIRTDYEKRTAERRGKVVALYRKYREKFPDASDNRIFGCVASDTGLTITGVRSICLEMGAAKPAKNTEPA